MVNYTLAPSTGKNLTEQLFFVTNDSGEICIKSPLDREIRDYHELSVIATDRGKKTKKK